jgi:Ni,Fe-hydrogenase III component G
LFDKIRFGHVWENQNTFSKNRLTFSVNKKLKEDYIKFWKNKLSLDGSEEKGIKLKTYRKLKEKYEIKNFLKILILPNMAESYFIKQQFDF